jgi:hypothetical protein
MNPYPKKNLVEQHQMDLHQPPEHRQQRWQGKQQGNRSLQPDPRQLWNSAPLTFQSSACKGSYGVINTVSRVTIAKSNQQSETTCLEPGTAPSTNSARRRGTSAAGFSIEKLPDDVGVPSVTSHFFKHVPEHPTEIHHLSMTDLHAVGTEIGCSIE